MDSDQAMKAFEKLSKSIKILPKKLLPEDVHSLRTHMRRVEAIVQALIPGENRDKNLLLKTLKPIRKKAGKVRDMDVLIAFAATLSKKDEECLVRLIEYLGAKRLRSANKLRDIPAEKQEEIRHRLRRCSSLIKKHSSGQKENNELAADATTSASSLWIDLSEWSTLKETNLHPFRLKVKELRYILQLRKEDHKEIVSDLGKVKDAIGEWHDWNELQRIAANVLQHGDQCALLREIDIKTKAKLKNALAVSNTLRKKYQPG